MRRTLAGGAPDRLRRHHRAGLALPARARWTTFRLFGDRKNGRVAIDLSAPDARGGAEGNLRHLRLPGAGDAGGAGARRLQPRRSRPAAPRDGQEDPVRRWTPSARASSKAAAANDIARRQGQRAVRLDRQVRRLWLQQEPRRRLRAGRLPHRLAEGAPPGRILRRVDELRHGADRQAGLVRRGHAPRRGRAACRPTSTPAAPTSRSRATAGPLRAGRAQGRRRESDGGAGRGARAQAAPSPSLDDFAERIDPRLLNRRQIESLAGAGAFD